MTRKTIEHTSCKIERLIIESNKIKSQYYTFKKWFDLSVDLWLLYIIIQEKLQEISIFKMRKIITVYSLLIFVGLDLVCIKCNQFIHPVTDEEYEILLKLCKGEFSVPIADRSKLQKSTIIKFWRNREKFSQNKNVLFYDGKKVLCLLFLLFY